MMNTNVNPTKKLDTKILLSTLWLLVMINILTADVLSLTITGSEEILKTTSVNTGLAIPILMLVGAVMNELSIVMILLSRILKYGMNRWVNILVSIITLAYIWGGGSSYPHYIFIAAVESVCLLLIIWIAGKWTAQQA